MADCAATRLSTAPDLSLFLATASSSARRALQDCMFPPYVCGDGLASPPRVHVNSWGPKLENERKTLLNTRHSTSGHVDST